MFTMLNKTTFIQPFYLNTHTDVFIYITSEKPDAEADYLLCRAIEKWHRYVSLPKCERRYGGV